jgi:hypothetical protein
MALNGFHSESIKRFSKSTLTGVPSFHVVGMSVVNFMLILGSERITRI